MRDDYMGGLLAFIIAAPIMVICCGGGGAILAAIIGGVGGWLTGLGGVAIALTALGVFLISRQVLRHRATRGSDPTEEAGCCGPESSHVDRPSPGEERSP